MTTRYVDISELTELSRREMMKAILDKRDAVVKTAGKVSQEALSEWQSTAPMLTGRLRNSVVLSKHKYTAGLKVADDRFRLVNILNSHKKGPHHPHGFKTAGFYDKYKSKYTSKFRDEALKD